ncbi:MAG: hypothetical protein FJ333_10660, partial [Sphingomonadales bacterium]|nr:hypothetical protein [Sphingomonadales bacterium]
MDSFYVFSNGGAAYFPENTLTNFTNKFPKPLKINKDYEIGLESIGFSSIFKNVLSPPDGQPSLIITNCNRSSKYYQGKIVKGENEGPIVWSFNEDTSETCHTYIDDSLVCVNQKCFYSMFSLLDKDYGDDEIAELVEAIRTKTKLNVLYEDRRMTFAIGKDWINTYGYNRCYIMMHNSFSQSFGFNLHSIRSYISTANRGGSIISDLIRVMKIGADESTQHYVRTAYRNGIKYDVFYIDSIPAYDNIDATEIKLCSDYIRLDVPPFPKHIKIVCDAIEPQIYNNEYSKNILVYTPDFNKLKPYTMEE